MSYESIAKYTGSSSTASWDAINFASIPNTYKHLMLFGKIAMYYPSSTAATFQLRFNNDTTAGAYNWSYQGARDGTGTMDAGQNGSGDLVGSIIQHARPASNDTEYGMLTIFIPNYASTTAKKVFYIQSTSIAEAPSQENRCWVIGGYWNNTAAIHTVNCLSDRSPDFVSLTDISLYGLKG